MVMFYWSWCDDATGAWFDSGYTFQQLPYCGGASFSSSSEWCILGLIYRYRYAQCKLCKVVDNPVMAQRTFPLVPVLLTTEISQLQSIDTVVDDFCAGPASSGSGREETVESPQLQPVSWTWSFTTPVVCNDRCPWSMSLMQFIDISHVPVIMQRRCTAEVPQIQLSPATVDIPVVQQRRGIFSSADDGGEDAFLRHFSRSSRLSRS